MYPDFILKALSVSKLPVLDTDKTGSTGYIDFIRVEDMSHSVMKGIDVFGRPFLTLKVISSKGPMVGTFFQRYSDDCNYWAYGTCYDSFLYHDSKVRVSDYEDVTERLKKLVDGEYVKAKNVFGNDIDEDIKLV
jgi:hypothetical protein